MQFLPISRTIHGASHWLLTLLAAFTIYACATGGEGDIGQTGDELKGGIPANGKEKSNMGKHAGQAGSVAVSDDDAGPGKGHGPKGDDTTDPAVENASKGSDHKNEKDKPKGSDNKPTRGPKADGGLGAEDDENEAADEGV